MAILGTIIGLFFVLGLLFYLILITVLIIKQIIKFRSSLLQVIELLFCPPALFISGTIWLFHGWRLDPILQLQQILLNSVVTYLVIKRVVNSSKNMNNKS